jgi:cation transport ATPase
MALVEIDTTGGATGDDVLRIAGALEDASEHPIAHAIARAAQAQTAPLPGRRGLHQPFNGSGSRASSMAMAGMLAARR